MRFNSLESLETFLAGSHHFSAPQTSTQRLTFLGGRLMNVQTTRFALQHMTQEGLELSLLTYGTLFPRARVFGEYGVDMGRPAVQF